MKGGGGQVGKGLWNQVGLEAWLCIRWEFLLADKILLHMNRMEIKYYIYAPIHRHLVANVQNYLFIDRN